MRLYTGCPDCDKTEKLSKVVVTACTVIKFIHECIYKSLLCSQTFTDKLTKETDQDKKLMLTKINDKVLKAMGICKPSAGDGAPESVKEVCTADGKL